MNSKQLQYQTIYCYVPAGLYPDFRYCGIVI